MNTKFLLVPVMALSLAGCAPAMIPVAVQAVSVGQTLMAANATGTQTQVPVQTNTTTSALQQAGIAALGAQLAASAAPTYTQQTIATVPATTQVQAAPAGNGLMEVTGLALNMLQGF